ncbi:MAG: DUF929 family protein [Streptomycetaceae bacterium]|nr:DUF929 family protein [Streptomycetaceae bacterium]
MSQRHQQARLRAREIAAARQRAARRHRRLLVAGLAVATVLTLAAVMVVVKLNASPTPPSAATVTASAKVVAEVTGVPAAVFDAVGAGAGMIGQPARLSGRAVRTTDGKPLITYIGAEYCPYCAAQRWPLIMALSRFGTFTGLGQTTSSATDIHPNTPTLSFHGAAYTSAYLVFDGVEIYTNQPSGDGGYTALDSPTAAQTAMLHQEGHDAFPFVDFAAQANITAGTLDPAMLAGLTHEQIAAALTDAGSPIGKAFGGSANAITAILCALTGGQPGPVCTSPAARAYEGQYGAGHE